MHNLIQARLSSSDIRSILSTSLQRPLLQPYNSSKWSNQINNPALRSFFAPMVELASVEANSPLPELTDELYAEFHRSGNRLLFENFYFERRRRYARAAGALLLNPEDNGTIKHSVIDKLTSIFDEESWALPAHVAATTGKDPMAIDLFAAETANTMAEALDLFSDIMPEGLANGIRKRLDLNFFDNYIDNHATLGWIASTNNWNAVCNQGVLGAALAAETNIDKLSAMLGIASESLRHFLTGFGVDGATSEGPGYWSYGFGWFCVLNEQLENVTGGALSLFDGDKHIEEIAQFGSRMSLTNGRTVNFADGSGCGQINPRLLGYLGNRLDNQQLHDQGLLAYNSLTAKPISLTHERADLFYFARLIRDWPDGTTDTAQSSNFDFYFRDIEAIVSRRRDISGRLWEFAAKAGHNDEAHNHNDCGSYLINIDGTPAVIEIGAPEYTREYFGPRRYQNIAARSLGHSVPLVNGIEQAPGPSFNSVVLKHEFGADKVTFSLDLSGCYPDEANIVRLERQFEFERTGIFGVTDLFELHAESENVETAIITSGRVTSLRNSVLIEIDEVTLTITPKPGARIADIVDYRYSNHEGHPASIRRIALRPVKRASSGELGYLLSIQ